MTFTHAENVEVALSDNLDGILGAYCLDIAGGNQNVDPANGLQAHTCYSYQGALGSDQTFDTEQFADNVLYMPEYDVCVQVDSIAAGSEVGLVTCDSNNELQSFAFSDDGTISPTSSTDLCFTAAEESRMGRGSSHQIRDLTLEACSDDLMAYQVWGAVAIGSESSTTESSSTTETSSTEESSTTSAVAITSSMGTCETAGTVEQSTDENIEELRQAIVSFRASLSDTLLSEASNCLDDERFTLWHNTPANDRGARDGIAYGDLTDDQLNDFKDMLQLFLSADGYQKVYEVTELAEGWLNNIMAQAWDPAFYSIDMFGEPETSGSWGVQLDGHHAVVNFLVHGDNVSIVPAFLGGEPAAGTYNGESYDMFVDERDLALSLYNSLSSDELSVAVSTSSTRELVVGPADKNGEVDPFVGEYDYSGFETGLKYSDMSETAQANLVLVMKEYVYNLADTFADVWWSDVEANIDDTYFVWIDDVDAPDAESQFYYRVYNPYLWAEFNTEDVTGANSDNIEDWNHIHTITRIPNNSSSENGGDYGIFASIINDGGPTTLLEHYASVDHHALSSVNFDYSLSFESNHSHSHN